MQRMLKRFVFVLSVVVLGSCAAHSTQQPSSRVAPPPQTAAAHENLNAVLWVQRALEYQASTVQAYRTASLRLDAALKDAAWTAAIEQTSDASKLPPAVILDVDETTLDNSYYQAQLIRDGTTFNAETWDRWCLEARATAIPGAVAFTRDADTRGVVVFYITNRTAKLEEATRRNLASLGFPLRPGVDTVLTRGERPEWQASPKGARRVFVASMYRILLMIGDDLGDFVVDSSGTPEERAARAAPQQDWWGRRWIMLPNPMYGSWERAVIGSVQDGNAARRIGLQYAPRSFQNR
jgi:acid phosphatase